MLKRVLSYGLGIVPLPLLERVVGRVLALRATGLPPDQALRFLLRLDALVYSLEGQLAVAYGRGVHVKHRVTNYHDFFVSRIQPGERVLDVGCGTGVVSADIAERSEAWVIGVDQNEENIRLARERSRHPRVRYLAGDALRSLPAEHFDVVVLSNVLEHLSERSQFLREIQRVLTPSRVLIRVPLFERDWRVPLRKELGIEWRLDVTHETEYTPESFAQEVTQAGMGIVHSEIRWGEIWAEVRQTSPT